MKSIVNMGYLGKFVKKIKARLLHFIRVIESPPFSGGDTLENLWAVFRVFPATVSQWPLTQNNPSAQKAYFDAVCPGPPRLFWWVIHTLSSELPGVLRDTLE